MKKLLYAFLLFSAPAFAQQSFKFPDNIPNYQKKENDETKTNETTLQLVLVDKDKMKLLSLNQQDLIEDANDLTMKIVRFFKPLSNVDKLTKKQSKKIKNNNEKGYLLITKYIFLGKDKPFKVDAKDDNEEIKNQVYNQAECKEGICTSHIIMGINYFDSDFKIKALDIKKFSLDLEKKDDKYIRGDYALSQEGVLKIYYFYGINGTVLPKNKEIIKNMIVASKK